MATPTGFGDIFARGLSSIYGTTPSGDPTRAGMAIQTGGKIFDYYQTQKQLERDEELLRREQAAQRRIMAEQLDEAATALEKADTSTPKKLGLAVEKYVKSVWKECSAVVFNGDGYSDAWHKEAAKRGLPNLRTSADALPEIKSKEVAALFKKYKVLSKRELDSRYEVYAEQYVGAVTVEAKTAIEMVRTQIFPAAIRYQTELAGALANLKAVGVEPDHNTLDLVTELIGKLQDSVADLAGLLGEHSKSIAAECEHMCFKVLPKMLEVRQAVDVLEGYVPSDVWPLPTYQDMLFIK